MTETIISRLQRFASVVLEIGLARGVLALPAPRMLALPSPSSDEASRVNVFTKLVVEPEIVDVSRDLFASGHYSAAVHYAFLAVDKYVQTRTKKTTSGTSLMEVAFSPQKPLLAWSDLISQSERDEQAGYHRLFAGAMLGIRNPCAHEFDWIDDGDVALEVLVLAQHLLRKAKLAASK